MTTTTVRVYFFGGGRDIISRLARALGRITGRSVQWTHVAVGFPRHNSKLFNGQLFHLTLGGNAWTTLREQLKWATSFYAIDVNIDPVTYDDAFNRIYGLEKGGARTTITGLADLFFRAERRTPTDLICTDILDIIMGTETKRSLTPDELLDILVG